MEALRRNPCGLLVAVLVPLIAAHAIAADWPQLLGPSRNGVYQGPPLSETWGATGPRVVWRRQVGAGLSGPVVAQNRVILFHRVSESRGRRSDGRRERQDGRGSTHIPPPTATTSASTRARARCPSSPMASCIRSAPRDSFTPSISPAERRFGARTRCDASAWRRGSSAPPARRSSRTGESSPTSAAKMPASSPSTQRPETCCGPPREDAASYSSGIGATIGGRRTAIFLTRNGLVGLDPATGQVRFQRPWRARQAASVNAATPVVSGDSIFVSAEYGPGAGVLRFDGSKLVDVWASDDALSNHYATSVYSGGYLYGFHGRQEFGQSFRAVEFQTGKVRWSEDEFGAGSVTLAGNRLLILRENGEMVLAAASPDGFKPLARAQILPATVRAYPAIADGYGVRAQRQHARVSGLEEMMTSVLGAWCWVLGSGSLVPGSRHRCWRKARRRT